MSRIGEKPVEIPAGVTVSVNGRRVEGKGAKGELSLQVPDPIDVAIDGGVIVLSRPDNTSRSKSFHGLSRSLVAALVEGVSKGFSKELEIEGVGFKAALDGQTLSLALGFASPILFAIPDGLTVTVDGGTKVAVGGCDKQKVGDCAARIRSYFPCEPYKGKGIRYKGEKVRRKVGKTVA